MTRARDLANIADGDITGSLTVDSITTSGDIDFADNAKAIFGAGSDLQIYHDGSNSYISEGGTGNLFLGATNMFLRSGTGETYLGAIQDGAVSLYHDNAVKIATTATGVDVTGVITTDGMTTSADINFGDNDKASFSSGKLQIYHDGTNAYIDETYASGTFLIRGNNISLQKYTGETMIQCVSDGKVELNFNNVPKLETTSTGVTITGTAVATTDTDATNTGNITLDFGANQNFVLTLTGSVTLDNPTTEQVGQSGFIVFIQDGTGGRTVSLGTDYETAGGAGITLSSAASATDIVPYVVAASGRILLGAPQLAFA